MRMLIDTNVIMDVLVGREPFLQHSQYVVKLCTNRVIQGYIAAHTITNLFYILRKYYSPEGTKCAPCMRATIRKLVPSEEYGENIGSE